MKTTVGYQFRSMFSEKNVRFFIIFLLAILTGTTYTQSKTISLTKASKSNFQVKPKVDSSDIIEVNIDLSSLKFDVKSTKSGDFVSLTAEGLGITFDKGKPNIPVYSKLIELPLEATVKFKVLSYDEEIIDLNANGISQKIVPAQPSVSKKSDTSEFFYNEKTYEENKYFNTEITNYEEVGIMRSIRLGRIIVNPIQYNPAKNILKVLNNLKIRIEFVGANHSKTKELKDKYSSSVFNNLISKFVPNSEMETESLVTEPITYLILAGTIFRNSTKLNEFITHKRTIFGFNNVIVAYIGDPGVGNTKETIKNYLQNQFIINHPDYVLLVGDIDQIPTNWPSANGILFASDLDYFDYTGDHIPDVFYGRFSAHNFTELDPQIDKTIEYENSSMPNLTYLSNATLISGRDNSGDCDIINCTGAIFYGTNQYFNPLYGLTAHTYLQPEPINGNYKIHLIEDINNGVGLVYYDGHGSFEAWMTDPGFTKNDISNLTNTHKYGLWIGNCCISNQFNIDECFGEAAVRAQNKGAVGYIGASNSTFWDEDYYWAVGFKTIIPNPNYDGNHLGAFDRLFHTHSESINDWCSQQGQIIFGGNLAVEESNSQNKLYYWQIYHLMGDPSLQIKFVPTTQELILCYGDSVLLTSRSTFNINDIKSISWSPTTGLNNSTILEPTASPNSTTIYTISVRMLNGEEYEAQTKVIVSGKPENAISKLYGRLEDSDHDIRTANVAVNEEISGLIKTAECGFLFSSQTTNDSLHNRNTQQIYGKSAYLIKTDCDGNPLWNKYYVRDYSNIGWHNSTAFNSCNAFSGSNFTNNVGYAVTGQSYYSTSQTTYNDMSVLLVDPTDGHLIDSKTFRPTTNHNTHGEFIQPTVDGGLIVLGNDETNNRFLVTKLIPTPSSLTPDYNIMKGGGMNKDCFIYTLSGKDLKAWEIKESKDYFVIAGQNSDAGSIYHPMIAKLNKSVGLTITSANYLSNIDPTYSNWIASSIEIDPETDNYYVLCRPKTTDYKSNKIAVIELNHNDLSFISAKSINIPVAANFAFYHNILDREPTIKILNDGNIFISANVFNTSTQNQEVIYVKIKKSMTDLNFVQSTLFDNNSGIDKTLNISRVGFGGMASVFQTSNQSSDLELVTSDGDKYSCENYITLTLSSLVNITSFGIYVTETAFDALNPNPVFSAFDGNLPSPSDQCQPAKICYCDDEHIHVEITPLTHKMVDEDNQCCYTINFYSLTELCNISRIDIVDENNSILGNYNTPNISLQNTSYSIRFCLSKFEGIKKITFKFYDSGSNLVCQTEKDFHCVCSCDDFYGGKRFRIKLNPTSKNGAICCYSVDMQYDLDCILPSEGIIMKVPNDLVSLFNFTPATNWIKGPPIPDGVLTKYNLTPAPSSHIDIAKDFNNKIQTIGTFCVNGTSLTYNIIFDINGQTESCNLPIPPSTISCPSNCCDILNSQGNEVFNITDDPNDPCCKLVHFYVDDIYHDLICTPQSLRITFPNDNHSILIKNTDAAWVRDMIGPIVTNNNTVRFCVPTEDNITNPLPITVEFIGLDGTTKCTKRANINTSGCQTCKERIYITCSCRYDQYHERCCAYTINYNPGSDCPEIYGIDLHMLWPEIGYPLNLPMQDIIMSSYYNYSHDYPYVRQELNLPLTTGEVCFMEGFNAITLNFLDKDGNIIYSQLMSPSPVGCSPQKSTPQFHEEDASEDNNFAIIIENLSAAPNPANNETTVTYLLNQPADVKLELFNSLGEKVFGINIPNGKVRSNSVLISTSTLTVGQYLLKIHTDTDIKTILISVVR